MTAASLTLASSSPRRLELLRQIGVEPDYVFAPSIDETPALHETPRAYVQRMALGKLKAASQPGYVIAADTTVAAGARLMPKAETLQQAKTCLQFLSGKRHRVYTAVALRAPAGRVTLRVVASQIGFARLTPAQIQNYLDSGEWQGKAGGYAIQGRAGAFINFISGSYSAVVGLPLHETTNLLRGSGYW